MAVALAECCFSVSDRKIGAAIQLPAADFESLSSRDDALLFGEAQSRIVVSCTLNNLSELRKIIHKNKIPFSVLGKVKGQKLVIKRDRDTLIDIPVDELEEKWEKGLTKYL